MTHPAIALAAAVAMPDPVFGEKVCLYAELVDSAHASSCPSSSNTCWRWAFPRNCCPNGSSCVDELPRSSGGKIAKGQLREDIRARMEADHERSERTPRRPGGVGAVGGAPDRRRAVRRAGARRGVPPPRRRRVRGEHGRPHHLAARRDRATMLVNPWGLWWAGTHRLRHLRGRQRRAGGPRPVGRHPGHPHPHRAPPRPRPTPGWSSTTTRTTSACSPRWAGCPSWSTRPGRCSSTTCAWSRNYDGEIDTPARAAELAARIGGANLAILANHGVIATGATAPRPSTGRHPSSGSAGWPTTCCSPAASRRR